MLKRLDTATLNLTQPKPDLGGVAERAEQLFIMARVSMDMPIMSVLLCKGHLGQLGG